MPRPRRIAKAHPAQAQPKHCDTKVDKPICVGLSRRTAIFSINPAFLISPAFLINKPAGALVNTPSVAPADATPKCLDPRIPPAIVPVEFVFHRIFLVIILMVFLGRRKHPRCLDLYRNRS